MTKLEPFYTDDKTAKVILAAAQAYQTQPMEGQVAGGGAAGVTGATTQFQNTCQFKLTTGWRGVKDSTKNFVASGEKIVPLQVGAEKRNYPTTIYAYGEEPVTGRDSVIAATRRANRWVLLPTGTSGESAPSHRKARLVQPKELFPACEYKTLQNVFGCLLEYSDDGESWIPVGDFHCGTRDVVAFEHHEFPLAPHQYWRVDLKGFSKPEDPNDENADRGFYTFGRLWEAGFWVERTVETKKTVTRHISKDEQQQTEYTFTAGVPNHWRINQGEPLAIELAISPEVPSGELFYKTSTGEWESQGAFSSTDTFTIAAEEIQIMVDEKMGKERYNTSFMFRIEQTADEYNPAFNEEEEESPDNPKIISVTREVGSLTLKRPAYTLSPERPDTFTVPEAPMIVEANDGKLTAKAESLWKSNKTEVSVTLRLDPPFWGRLYYRAELCSKCLNAGMTCAEACQERKEKDWAENHNGDENYEGKCSVCLENEKTCAETCHEWQDFGEIFQEKTIVLPAGDLKYPQITFFDFAVRIGSENIIDVRIPRPTYPMSSEAAEVALPPPREDVDVEHLYFDSKPDPRKAENHRYWMLTFDEPEVVTQVLLDVDRHCEHYIIAPGGRDANKEDIPFIYAFDLASEKWTATTFPELQEPMYNMDAKVVELADGTHQLIVLSGQVKKGFSNIIQGYNFEKDYIKVPIDLGELGINFAGRPALVGDPTKQANGQATEKLLRSVGTTVILPEEEDDFSRSLIVIGGSDRSAVATPGGSGNSTLDSVLFSVRGETQAIGSPYRIQTQAMSMAEIGHTGLPFGRFEYRSYVGSANSVITRLRTMGTYARHQNLPVRGILRRQPKGNTSAPSNSLSVVDFLLIGGFNEGVNREEYNKSVVSGFFNAMTWSANSMRTQTFYTMAIPGVTSEWDSFADRFLYYPPTEYVLGDCCAEYVYEEDEDGNILRDEVICFGGRPAETDTVMAHAGLAVLEFDRTPNSNKAQWLYGVDTGYPDMPHPRWSAASVLIKGLVRTGESEPCDRIFIIGGRNKDGFVPEVDVFNLRYNEWETDWKGLDSGELETIPASLGGNGATIVVQGGGNGSGSGIQSIKPGDGIAVTGDSKNPTVAVHVQDIVEQLVQSETFLSNIVHKLVDSETFLIRLAYELVSNRTLIANIVHELVNNETFFNNIVDELVKSKTFLANLAHELVNNKTLITNIVEELVNNETFFNKIVEELVTNETFLIKLSHTLVNNKTLLTNIVDELVNNETFITDIVKELVDHETFLSTLVEELISHETFISNVAGKIISEETIVNDIVHQVVTNETLFTQITEQVFVNPTFIHSIAYSIVNHETVIAHITNEILQSNVLVQNIVDQMAASIVSMKAPDGSTIATIDDGVITLQLAANEKFGIVKGQQNDSPDTWQNVSAANGLLSVNREQAEAVMDTKDTATRNAINVQAEDGCIVGRNENGIIILPFRYVETEPTSPIDGTLYLIKEVHAATP